ncbi:TIGR04013 family B12-binding domain/radical SAM domain-containing protein [Methanolapillus ohkumae]|uniref:tRNA-2-methylthio-N(6)-dimethylallyladenosine synthase n=1 Tax=Methanolapillus ohkumae TaxID=3028298 RepID=A0AA96V7I7_9EURY|nr:tRNA-2-methylthio-N(6)-dimethylallyladenosine synthase [Methanosarcinaceae archaeon Am2]
MNLSFPVKEIKKQTPVFFRFLKKNSYSFSALAPLLADVEFSNEPAPGIMIYSFFTRQKEEIFLEVSRAKKEFQALGIPSFFIAGGPHPSGVPDETLQYFDAVVVGEGEETLPELVAFLKNSDLFSEQNQIQNIQNQIQNKYQNKRKSRQEFPDFLAGLSKIPGIAYLDDFGKMVLTKKRPFVNLDTFPCFSPDNIWRPLEISRGCPHRCKFCQTPQIFGHKMRHRSIPEILKYAKYYDDLRFISSNAFAYGGNGVTPNPGPVKELLSALSEIGGKRIFFGTFPSEVRPEFITEEMMELVTTYCANDSISIGAQSGSDDILQEIGRGHTAEDVYSAVEICLEKKIIPIVDFIIGFPNETEKDQEKTLELIDWICQKNGEVRAHYLTPLPSTPYENIIPGKVHPEISKKLGQLALGGKLKGVWENTKPEY